MTLTELDNLAKLSAERKRLVEDFETIEKFMGDSWISSKPYYDSREQPKFQFTIPLGIVKDCLTVQIKFINKQLEELGVYIP